MRIESAIGERHVPMDTMQAPDPEWDIGWHRQNPHGMHRRSSCSKVIVEFGLNGQAKWVCRVHYDKIFVIQFLYGNRIQR